MILLGLMLLPALILVGVLVQAKDLLGLDRQIVPYSTYPITTQLLVSVFVAAQAPALISRDRRFRTITLYLARPMRRSAYVWSLRLPHGRHLPAGRGAAALMYVGGLLAGLPLARESGRFLGALVGARCSPPACPAWRPGLGATIRRGLAVAAVIVVLLVSYTVVVAIQGISYESGHETVSRVAGVFSPYTLVNGVQVVLFDSPRRPRRRRGAAMGVLYVVATLLAVGGSLAA